MIKRILLTNDDGIDAPGLANLAMVLGSQFDVFVVAPDRERSGVGHAFTLFMPLRCDEVPGKFPDDLVRRAWKCSGTPVDCVKMGLLQVLAQEPPDLVISGINRGANLAIDTLYSGTVSAALEAMTMGQPAIAVSLVSHPDGSAIHDYFAGAADFVLDYVRRNDAAIRTMRGHCLNINIPGLPRQDLRGVRYTSLGRCRYDDRYQVHRDPNGRPYYWLEGTVADDQQAADADLVAIRERYVSITPLMTDLTAHDILARLQAANPAPGPEVPPVKSE
jgi:5'-nucleotidase